MKRCAPDITPVRVAVFPFGVDEKNDGVLTTTPPRRKKGYRKHLEFSESMDHRQLIEELCAGSIDL